MFFMITGALLLNKGQTITYDKCVRKFAKRILFELFLFGIPFA